METNVTKFLLNMTLFNDTSFKNVDDYIFYSTLRQGLKQLPFEKPILPEFGPVVNDITSISYRITPRPCKNETFLLVIVVSAPHHFEKRLVLRKTWMKDFDASKTVVTFVTGLTSNSEVTDNITKEASMYDDILQINMTDSYYNLTEKFVATLKWIHSYCPKISFVLKCDDDVYVNVRNLFAAMNNMSSNEKHIYGSEHANFYIVQRGQGILSKFTKIRKWN